MSLSKLPLSHPLSDGKELFISAQKAIRENDSQSGTDCIGK